MKTLYKKELAFYLNNPIGYIAIILFGVFANFLFVKDIFLYGVASMRSFFEMIPWLLLIFVPALTMRSMAEERRTGTLDVLMSLPLSELQIVLAKFLSILTIVLIGLILTAGLPVSLYFLTSQVGSRIYFPEILIGYVGVLLCAGLFTSIGLLYSSLTKNQMIAFLISAITFFFLLVFSGDFVAHLFPPTIQDILSYASPMTHMRGFDKGVVDLRSLYYFLSTIVIGIVLTTITIEKRN